MKLINNFAMYYTAFMKTLYPLNGNPFTDPEGTTWKGAFNLQTHKFVGLITIGYHLFQKQLGMWHLILWLLPVYLLMKYFDRDLPLLQGTLSYFAILALNGFILWL